MPSRVEEWRHLVEEAATCRNCELWRNATQTVFGQGPVPANGMFVGEQPGDQEDRQGAPFVGPAGRVFDDGLEQAGIDRDRVYVTNAVKHFKWTPRGKRRIHQKPNGEEVRACAPWLESELAIVKPEVLVLMGAVAAQALLGSSFRVSREARTAAGLEPRAARDRYRASVVDPPRRAREPKGGHGRIRG